MAREFRVGVWAVCKMGLKGVWLGVGAGVDNAFSMGSRVICKDVGDMVTDGGKVGDLRAVGGSATEEELDVNAV